MYLDPEPLPRFADAIDCDTVAIAREHAECSNLPQTIHATRDPEQVFIIVQSEHPAELVSKFANGFATVPLLTVLPTAYFPDVPAERVPGMIGPAIYVITRAQAVRVLATCAETRAPHPDRIDLEELEEAAICDSRGRSSVYLATNARFLVHTWPALRSMLYSIEAPTGHDGTSPKAERTLIAAGVPF